MVRPLFIITVFLALSNPAAADGAWNIAAPKGWHRVSSETERTMVEATKKQVGGKVGVDIRQWLATRDGDGRALTGMFLELPTAKETALELATEMTNSMVAEILAQGFEQRPSTPPRIKGQAVVTRILDKGQFRMLVQTRAVVDNRGRTRVLLVSCGESADRDTCKRAMGSIVLSSK